LVGDKFEDVDGDEIFEGEFKAEVKLSLLVPVTMGVSYSLRIVDTFLNTFSIYYLDCLFSFVCLSKKLSDISKFSI
jgi:hypothetical protein